MSDFTVLIFSMFDHGKEIAGELIAKNMQVGPASADHGLTLATKGSPSVITTLSVRSDEDKTIDLHKVITEILKNKKIPHYGVVIATARFGLDLCWGLGNINLDNYKGKVIKDKITIDLNIPLDGE